MNLGNLTNRLNQWLARRQQRVLEEAYQSARVISELETQYFNGEKIASSHDRSKTVYDYVRSLRDRQLLNIRSNLIQFGAGNFLFNHQHANQESLDPSGNSEFQSDEIIQKLNYIESVIAKYREDNFPDAELLNSKDTIPTNEIPDRADADPAKSEGTIASVIDPPIIEADSHAKQSRSLFRKLTPFRSEVREAEYERQAVINIRLRRQQNQIATRFLIIIILVPLLTQILAKHLLFDPILGNYSDRNPEQIQLTQAIRKKFDEELRLVNARLDVENLLGIIPELTPELKREKLKEAAVELWQESRNEALNGLKNLLADGVALVVFVVLVYFGRNKIAILRIAANRSFLNLYDPVKVFLFILFTDMFVGFHSAEGWEVILESIAEHFGIPANETFIKGFIATVPVFLDSWLKFWIFTYLTRFSPASSAIYERMNT
ncbi:CemA family protein [Stanieria sp. NIES-3757]|nr:CemA family protein [Stanieria sp. NIES-3757]